MDILVVNSHGHGAIIYSRLASTGQHHAQLLDDSRRAFALDFKPLAVRSPLGHYNGAANHIEPAEITRKVDLIVACCRADQVADLAKVLPRAIKPGTIILPLIDGVAHQQRLFDVCPFATILDGATSIVGVMNPTGAVAHAGQGRSIVVAARSAKEREAVVSVQRQFAGTGIDIRLVDDVQRLRWDRLIRMVATGGIATLLRARLDRIATLQSGCEHLWTLLQECRAVALASGQAVDIATLADFAADLPNVPAAAIRKLLNEIANGELREVAELVEQVYSRARQHNLPTPLLDLVQAHLQVQDLGCSRYHQGPPDLVIEGAKDKVIVGEIAEAAQ
jgi:2-dehydropantoate 2-reductase